MIGNGFKDGEDDNSRPFVCCLLWPPGRLGEEAAKLSPMICYVMPPQNDFAFAQLVFPLSGLIELQQSRHTVRKRLPAACALPH